MKFLVDKMPERKEDCCFCTNDLWDGSLSVCAANGLDSCDLEQNEYGGWECSKLMKHMYL